jgi:hypothetical protein
MVVPTREAGTVPASQHSNGGSLPTLSLFLNPHLRKKTLAFPGARAYHSRRSYHHAANTNNKNWLPTNGQFFIMR